MCYFTVAHTIGNLLSLPPLLDLPEKLFERDIHSYNVSDKEIHFIMLTPNTFVIHTIHRFFGMVTLFVVDAIDTTEKIFHIELISTFLGRGEAQE